jgi:hypothetical protein
VATSSKGEQAKTGGAGGTAIRTIAPLIPLAIALIHGALTGPRPAAPAPAKKIGTTVAAPVTPGCGGASAVCTAPVPLLTKGHPVDWWFVFKLNAGKFPSCGDGDTRTCPFGGTVQKYKLPFGQQFVFASSEAAALQEGGKECLGTSTGDPVGATFDEVYHGGYHYVVWNDQTRGDPAIAGCGVAGCDAPWGHSKGLLAWNDAGEGLVVQVSTPSWPGAASALVPRKTDGNTLGCVKDDDVEVSQHFFALRLTEADLVKTLKGLVNARVVTNVKDPQMVKNGGPADVQAEVSLLGVKPADPEASMVTLSSGVQLLSKPSTLHVPPWQLVSAELGGIPLRTANWWAWPAIPSTTADTVVGCWESTLHKPGAVEIATTGLWNKTVFGLKGGDGADANHAKLGVSTVAGSHYAIFGDMNQQGTLSGNCDSSQNGRGGLFFVMENALLAESLTSLISGQSAPLQP